MVEGRWSVSGMDCLKLFKDKLAIYKRCGGLSSCSWRSSIALWQKYSWRCIHYSVTGWKTIIAAVSCRQLAKYTVPSSSSSSSAAAAVLKPLGHDCPGVCPQTTASCIYMMINLRPLASGRLDVLAASIALLIPLVTISDGNESSINRRRRLTLRRNNRLAAADVDPSRQTSSKSPPSPVSSLSISSSVTWSRRRRRPLAVRWNAGVGG